MGEIVKLIQNVRKMGQKKYPQYYLSISKELIDKKKLNLTSQYLITITEVA